MYITDNRCDLGQTRFSGIAFGDVFEYMGEFYVRGYSESEDCLAINLDGGKVIFIDPDTYVLKLEVELVISDY